MKGLDVVKKNDAWVGESKVRQCWETQASREVDAVRQRARVAKADSQAVTVKIHKETGPIQEERTYPGKRILDAVMASRPLLSDSKQLVPTTAGSLKRV